MPEVGVWKEALVKLGNFGLKPGESWVLSRGKHTNTRVGFYLFLKTKTRPKKVRIGNRRLYGAELLRFEWEMKLTNTTTREEPGPKVILNPRSLKTGVLVYIDS